MDGIAAASDSIEGEREPLVPTWPWQVGAVLDATAFVMGAFGATLLVLDHPWPRVVVLSYLLFLLGWAVLRAAGAPACALTAVGAVATSVTATIAAATVAVGSFSWPWRGAAVVLVATGLAASMMQRWRLLRSDGS